MRFEIRRGTRSDAIRRRRRFASAGALVLVFLIASRAGAAEQFIYPSKGQSAAQQDKDKYECYRLVEGADRVRPDGAAFAEDTAAIT